MRKSTSVNAVGEQADPALAVQTLGIDADWRERIELAKCAYQDGKKLRDGKPITFRLPGPLPTLVGRYPTSAQPFLGRASQGVLGL